MSGLNKAEQLRKISQSKEAKDFVKEAPMAAVNETAQAMVEEAKFEEAKATKVKNSPWRESSGLTDEQLLSTEKRFCGYLSMELQSRLNFIKTRINAENMSKGKRGEKVSLNDIQAQAVEEYTAKILKKWGYDI